MKKSSYQKSCIVILCLLMMFTVSCTSKKEASMPILPDASTVAVVSLGQIIKKIDIGIDTLSSEIGFPLDIIDESVITLSYSYDTESWCVAMELGDESKVEAFYEAINIQPIEIGEVEGYTVSFYKQDRFIVQKGSLIIGLVSFSEHLETKGLDLVNYIAGGSLARMLTNKSLTNFDYSNITEFSGNDFSFALDSKLFNSDINVQRYLFRYVKISNIINNSKFFSKSEDLECYTTLNFLNGEIVFDLLIKNNPYNYSKELSSKLLKFIPSMYSDALFAFSTDEAKLKKAIIEKYSVEYDLNEEEKEGIDDLLSIISNDIIWGVDAESNDSFVVTEVDEKKAEAILDKYAQKDETAVKISKVKSCYHINIYDNDTMYGVIDKGLLIVSSNESHLGNVEQDISSSRGAKLVEGNHQIAFIDVDKFMNGDNLEQHYRDLIPLNNKIDDVEIIAKDHESLTARFIFKDKTVNVLKMLFEEIF